MTMGIFCGDYQIKILRIDSRSEMREALMRHKKGSIELKESSYSCEYYILSYIHHSENEKFGIGIYSENSGFPPSIIPYNEDSKLVIIHDNHLTLFDLCSGEICFSYASDSIIYFSTLYGSTIVLVSELSVVQLKQNGDILIVHTLDDVLEEFKLGQNSIICRTMSSTTKCSLIIV